MPATKVHFNGSVNLTNAEEVMRTIASRVPKGISRIPDGETGERHNWNMFQVEKLMALPGLTQAAQHGPGGFSPLTCEISVEELAWPDPGYAGYYGDSYEVFTRLRAEGVIPEGVRFQAEFPTPASLTAAFAPDQDADKLLVRSEVAMFSDLHKLMERVPHEDLAIQWDVCMEVWWLSGVPLGPSHRLEKIPETVARCVNEVAKNVPVGLHLCYGDAGHKHLVEPDSMRLQVNLANSVVAASHRPVSWVSLTVPQDRSDPEFFAPLASLKLGQAKSYLGIVPYHPESQTPGTTQKQAELIERYLPAQYASDWGISLECGMGRIDDREEVLALIDNHREILAALEPALRRR